MSKTANNLQLFPEKVESILHSWRPDGPDDPVLKQRLDTPEWSLETLWRVAAYYHAKLAFNQAAPYYLKLLQWSEYDSRQQAAVLTGLGHILMLKGDYAQALHSLLSARRLQADSQRLDYFLAETHWALNDSDAAFEALIRFCESYTCADQLLIRAWRKLALEFDARGEAQTAQAVLDKAHELTGLPVFQSSASAYAGLIAYKEEQGQVLTRAVPQNPATDLFADSASFDRLSEGLCEHFGYRQLLRSRDATDLCAHLAQLGSEIAQLSESYFNRFAPLAEPHRKITVIGQFNSPYLEPYLEALIELSRRQTVTFIVIGKIPELFKQEQWMRVVSVPNDLMLIYQALERHSPHLLIYADLGPHQMHTYALASQRLAPVQMALGSYPSTTGLSSIDFFLSLADLESEEAASHYLEKLQGIAGTPLKSSGLPERFIERKNFRLLSQGGNYLCALPVSNLHQDFPALLAQILSLDPQGQILIPTYPHEQVNRHFAQRFAAEYPEQSKRLHFLPPLRELGWLSLMREVDVVLDPIYIGIFAAGWKYIELGTPIVSWRAPRLSGRFCSSLYGRLGLEDSIVESLDDYAATAVALAQDAEAKARYREHLQTHRARLYAFEDYVDSLETFLNSHLP